MGFAGEEYAGTSNFISGEAIDGYISGAEIFIDQNFNFKKDGHEYVATTAEDGSFTIDVIGDAYECLVNRPIVANVPVGAIDSTTGEVTEAYQMILPSISDAGAAQVVISPFTTIFSEAIIKGKEEAKLKDELTQDQACGTVGNNLASEISTRITELKDSIESTYGISYETILGDFIEAGASGVVSETNAQNVAAFFSPIKQLQDGISSAMTSELGLPITANITFEEEVLDMVFGGEVLSELPINFYSVYTTEPNDLGWRREVSFRANGAKVDNQGKIKAYKCLNNPASDCESLNLNLENLGNFSQDYRQTVAFYYGLGNGDSVTIGNATGLMVVDASDVKYFGESNGSDLFACGTEEQIQLRGDSVDGLSWEYKYQTNYDESSGDKNGCQTSQSLRRGSIEILLRDESSNIVIGTQYIMPDMANTSLFSTTPVKLIENFESIDPKAILTEISTFPSSINDIEEGRSKLSGNETLEYSWRENYESGSFKTQYTLTVYATNNTNSDQLIINEYDDGNTTPTSTTEIQGAEAIQRLAEHLNSQSDSATAIFYTKQSIEGEAIDGYIEVQKYILIKTLIL